MCACGNKSNAASAEVTKIQDNQMTTQPDSNSVVVDITTSLGDIKVLLYGDTPKHRDNFVKLVNEGFYNGVLFHRVINEFMIQAGDPDSKTAKPGQHLGAGGPDYKIAPAGKMLGSGDPGYTLEAEFVYPKHFHKRGALAAARTGDDMNPERRSSGSQFYIVTGKAYNESQLAQMEKQMAMMQKQEIFNKLVEEHRDSVMAMRRNRDQAGLQKLQEELVAITEQKAAENPAKMTPEQRQAYSTIGGTPHLDGSYTVFGEVIEGMDVVDKIQNVETGAADRPVEDVKIIKMSIEK